MLLIDDVQFFANKERTQEEFFNAFEALLAKKSHIVLTSDTYPKGLADIHERLVSRFDSGLTVAIEPPELEMRVAILINKAAVENAVSPGSGVFVQNVRSRARARRALRKILAYSGSTRKKISIQLRAMRARLCRSRTEISVENIQKTVAASTRSSADCTARKARRGIARPRQIACSFKELTRKACPKSRAVWGANPTTVLHAVRKIGAERSRNQLNQDACAGTDLKDEPTKSENSGICPRRAPE